ncbi:hypothetical protein AVEN_178216-1 [Araneus ventricosus]|uniref:Uncharacterized protein n=1 Tax=Araneus ventricosus TaxID=182803 RepID=A0A4Y2H4U7_ARAVE|nr:hypothetical protein AVEN_178216-1 [Araneus ventricosus]
MHGGSAEESGTNSNLEFSGPEAETLPLDHCGPVAFQLRKCTDLQGLTVAKQRIKQVLFDLEMPSLNRQCNHLPSHSLDSSMPDTSATTFSEATTILTIGFTKTTIHVTLLMRTMITPSSSNT